MRIKEFFVTRYGPLSNKTPFRLGSFNLFFGKNEEGKTLTIDALVKLLLGKNAKKFEHIDRVEEEPEGYVIIEDDKGKEIKLPEKGELTKVVDLTPLECSNIFVIRNSELSIARESEFYTNVTDRLTGLRTEEISEIKDTLREIGKITPMGTLRDVKDEKLKTRVEGAKSLTKEVERVSKKIKKERLDRIEEKSTNLKEDIEKIRQNINLLEDAERREKYKKGEGALDTFKDCVGQVKELSIYNKDDEQSWRDSERDIKKYNQEKEKLFAEFKEKEKDFKQIEEKLRKKEEDFQIFNERKQRLDNEVKPELRNYKVKNERLVTLEGKSKFFNSVGIISTILFGIALFGIIIRPLLVFYIFTGAFFILVVISVVFRFRIVNLRSQLKNDFEKIKLTLARFKLDAENIEKTLLNVQKFEEEHFIKSSELGKIREDKGILESEIKKLEEKQIPEVKNRIDTCEKEVKNIKRKSKEESFQKYAKKLELKQKFEESKKEQRGILESHFGIKGKTAEENISYWEKEIGKIEEYRERAKGIEYNENTIPELKKKKQSFEKELEEIKKEMKSFQQEMEEIGRAVYKVLLEKEYLHCETLVDLVAIKDKLQDFIDKNENNRDNTLGAIEIFEEIGVEEQGKVSKLFGKESLISKHFNGITGGLYEEVILNQKSEEVEVKRKDGIVLEARKLSGGAYDQLYLSIRVALGRNLLKDRKGFFIMDDPFIKADIGRLQKQMNVLKELSSKLGWQIIYFTAKDEVKNVLRKDIESNKVKYIGIPAISP